MILFRKKQPIKKHQAGGSVTHYYPYKVQLRQESTAADIGVMLDKHKPKTKASGKGDSKVELPNPYKDIKGLQVDKQAYMAKARDLEDRLNLVMTTDPNYQSNPEFLDLNSKLNQLYSTELDHLAQEKAAHDDASQRIKDGGYGDQWVMQNGVGVAINNKTGKTEYIQAASIHATDKDGSKIYRPVKYKKGLQLRENSLDEIINIDNTKGSMIVNGDFTNTLASGISTKDAYKELIDPVFTDIGYTADSAKETYKNVTFDGATFYTEKTDREDAKSNINQLNSALETLPDRLASSPGFNTLVADAYQESSVAKIIEDAYKEARMADKEQAKKIINNAYAAADVQASQIVINRLKLEAAKRLQTEGLTVKVRDLEETEEEKAARTGEGPHKALPESLDAVLGMTRRVSFTYDIDPEGTNFIYTGDDDNAFKPKEKFDFTTRLEGHVDDRAKESIDFQKPISKQRDLEKMFLWKKARFLDGTLVNNITMELDSSIWSKGKPYKGLDALVVDENSDVVISYIPVDKNGKMIQIPENPMYQDMQKDPVLKQKKEELANATLSPNSEPMKQLKQEIHEREMFYWNNIANGYYHETKGKISGINVQAVAILKVIGNDEEIMNANGTELDEDHPIRKTMHTVDDLDQGAKDNYNIAMSKIATDESGKKDVTEVTEFYGDPFYTYITVPITDSYSSIVRSDKDKPEIYVPLYDVTAANLGNKVTTDTKGRRMTGEEVKRTTN